MLRKSEIISLNYFDCLPGSQRLSRWWTLQLPC
jgi:hypothetical protein